MIQDRWLLTRHLLLHKPLCRFRPLLSFILNIHTPQDHGVGQAVGGQPQPPVDLLPAVNIAEPVSSNPPPLSQVEPLSVIGKIV